MNNIVESIINEFKEIEQVIAITLAGSIANQTEDNLSDIDIDIYTSEEISVDVRDNILKKYAKYKEIGNDFFGPGDEIILENEQAVDIVYFDWSFITNYLENVLDKHNASTGYTTCFWHNVTKAIIVFDRNNQLETLRNKYTIEYPQQLKQNIISKNYPILNKNLSAYSNQIAKAIKRNDVISVNHRVAALLASYFDIIFAINEMKHPGEKKLIKIINNQAKYIPNHFEEDIKVILSKSGVIDISIIDDINNLVKNLEILLDELGIKY